MGVIRIIIQKKTAQKPMSIDTFIYTCYRKHYANIYIIHTNSPSCIPGRKLTPGTPGLLRCFQAHQINITALRCGWGCSDWHWKFYQAYSCGRIINLLFIFQEYAISWPRQDCCPRDYAKRGHLQSIYKSLYIYNIYKPTL